MKIYNTLSKKLETFAPINEGEVRMYVCGPTVYDYAHLGHGRSAVAFDIARRYLIYLGYKVTYVSNYTDIDDKMITRANNEGISVKDLADKIIPHYIEDYAKLNILRNDISPLATEFVPEMLSIIEALENKGYTYVIEDGVYFDTEKDSDYGKLSGQDIKKLEAGARLKETKAKKSTNDFVLWKFGKPNEPSWDSKWGKGRPGWHIECSAMSMKLLGKTFDIHAGGLDLIFPHHECEIAQSESANEAPYVRYWLHNGFVQVDNEKMSKSLGNFFTLKDIYKEFSPRAVRYFLISTHYRGPINFSQVQLHQAEQTLKRIDDFVFNVNNLNCGAENGTIAQLTSQFMNDFDNAMQNDFEVPGALSSLFEFIRSVNVIIGNNSISIEEKELILNTVRKTDSVFGLLSEGQFNKNEDLDITIDALINEREKYRKEKDFKKADEIRDILKKKGIELLDVKDGIRWKKV